MKQALKNSLIEYGNQLKAIRLAIGLSQKDAAAEIGIDTSNLCKIENGQFNISLATLVNILQNYGWRMCFVIQAEDFVKTVTIVEIDPSMQ